VLIRKLHRPAAIALGAAVAACAPAQAQPEPTDVRAQRLLCPELGGNSDPLETSYADKPAADARIRALVSAVRGLNDATLEMERRAVDACSRMRHDLGAAELTANSPLDAQCEPVRTLIAKVAADGIVVKVNIAPPKCQTDASRQAKCAGVTAASAPEAEPLCTAASVIYSRCSLPAVTFAAARETDETARLGKTLEQHLPSLLYAQYALGQRLTKHLEPLVQAGPKLGEAVKDAGPHGLACVGLSTTTAARSAERIKSFLGLSTSLVASLSPEWVSPPEAP
jgi:hypothetical protein